jgi:hypothetical protein
MPFKVDAYTVGGKASGFVALPGHIRDILESSGELTLSGVRWQPLGALESQPARDLTIAIDDVLIAVSDDDPSMPVHASWHAIRLEVGPYVVEGEMPTLPGYDPGRSLTRPSGEFVMLRDVRVGRTGGDEPTPVGQQGLINRYGVERVEADLMLGFFFPGAAMDAPEARGSGAAGGGSAPAPAGPVPAARSASTPGV